MQNMSFAMTVPQYLDGTKDVTRRLGWLRLKPGQETQAVRKSQGLKPGEKITPLGINKTITTRREPLNAITEDDVRREGFPGKSPEWFILHFCESHKKCTPTTVITRIEFLNPHRKES